MNRKTRAIIAATVIGLGIGTIALGYLEDESTVRYVSDLYVPANGLDSGSYTLLGIPQPMELPDGSPNPNHINTTGTFRSWTGDDGTEYITWITVSANQTANDEWTFLATERTTTRSSTEQVGPLVTHEWVLVGDHQVFQVWDFESGQRVWAAFGGVLNGDIQPKPSQLQGRLADAPDGVLVWLVEPDGYTVGCSSKFLPDDVKDDYDADGDGYTD